MEQEIIQCAQALQALRDSLPDEGMRWELDTLAVEIEMLISRAGFDTQAFMDNYLLEEGE